MADGNWLVFQRLEELHAVVDHECVVLIAAVLCRIVLVGHADRIDCEINSIFCGLEDCERPGLYPLDLGLCDCGSLGRFFCLLLFLNYERSLLCHASDYLVELRQQFLHFLIDFVGRRHFFAGVQSFEFGFFWGLFAFEFLHAHALVHLFLDCLQDGVAGLQVECVVDLVERVYLFVLLEFEDAFERAGLFVVETEFDGSFEVVFLLGFAAH